MSTELTVQQKFEEQIKDRLREDVGKLLPDEMLAKLVEESIQRMFFTKDKSGYHDKPSWFEQEVSDIYKAKLKEAIKQHFVENEDKILQAISEVIKDAAPRMMAEFIRNTITDGVCNLATDYNIQEALANKLRGTY